MMQDLITLGWFLYYNPWWQFAIIYMIVPLIGIMVWDMTRRRNKRD